MNMSNLEPEKLPVKVPVTQVTYHGKAGQVFRLHLLNLFLNIITFGIYSFWGKTRIRKYMTSHVAIENDRFEYTGTGKELLLGWLKAMLIFLPVMVCLSTPYLQIPAFIVLFGIISVAIFLAMRYRLSRTKWRGIRFNLAGQVKEYFILFIKRTVINFVTLGFKVPQSDILLWSYMANNMSYGDLKFSYEGDYSRLQKIHLKTLSIFVVAILIGFSTLVWTGVAMSSIEKNNQKQMTQSAQTESVSASQDSATHDPQTTEPLVNRTSSEFGGDVVGGIFAFYIALGLGLLSRIWYQAALWHEKFRGLRLGNLRFKSDVAGGELAKLYFTNILITLFTLGLGKPIAAHRTLRYYATHMRIGGDLSELHALQVAQAQKSGMGDALAADVGFDMGM